MSVRHCLPVHGLTVGEHNGPTDGHGIERWSSHTHAATAARKATSAIGEPQATVSATGTNSPSTKIDEDSTFDMIEHR